MTKFQSALAVLSVALLPTLVFAASGHDAQGEAAMSASAPAGHDMARMHADMNASTAGMAGDPAKADRTIAVEMHDNMRFTPDKISVKAGETVRFFIVNKGQTPHEMVIGTAEEIDEHAAMMKKMPGMVHKEANQITLAPGQRGGIVWQFAKAGTVSYACLIPGHKDAGMLGTIDVN
ncbi:MAG: cupredoxin family protein [Burkholderiales bacterium]